MILPPSLIAFLERGGPVLWLIAALSVLTLALILWKLWQLARLGAWSGAATAAALEGYAGPVALMKDHVDMFLIETTAHARIDLAHTRSGLRALELIATTAPLLGLLGTVVGMIDAFQALQEAGSRADPAALAGGIWEALLTTAAGMAVAIPAGVALTWFESIAARLQGDMETAATRVFTRGPKAP